MLTTLSQVFKKNRAEEFPDDLWGKFVLPIEYHKYNLLENDKGVKVIGGRGSGKTMFLKYHCYPTQLSSKRESITDDDINNVGIYWRPDTHFVQLINENYLKERWESTFNTYVSLSLLLRFSKFLNSLLDSNYNNEKVKEAIRSLTIPTILADELKCNRETLYTDLHKHCSGLIFKLQNWLHEPEDKFHVILDGKAIAYIINELQSSNLLQNTNFHIFIDEFENIRTEHQIIINTWMKHGEKPLIFNVAYKKYASVAKETSGKENLERRNDHRIIDIVDDVYAKKAYDFKLFSSEIIVNKLQEFYPQLELIDKNITSDINKLPLRRSEKHQKYILGITNKLLPELDYKQISMNMIEDETLNKKILRNIIQALKEKDSNLNGNLFIDNTFPEASLVNSILLFRAKTNPNDLLKTFNLYKEKPNAPALKAYREQVQNNLVGSILYIYTSFPKRICPIYAGFDHFSLMSKNNLRHLLELCYQSIIEFENNIEDLNSLRSDVPTINIEYQLRAAKFCSKQELETISEHGEYGQRLQKIANRLGILFSLKQRIRTQSKPENIHFSVDVTTLNDADIKIKTLLEEAKLWNVLQEYNATKGTTDDIAVKEYMLTPILAPYYQVTYRKKHKIEFTLSQLKTIFLDSDEKFDELYKSYIKDWKIDIDNLEIGQQSLFGDLF